MDFNCASVWTKRNTEKISFYFCDIKGFFLPLKYNGIIAHIMKQYMTSSIQYNSLWINQGLFFGFSTKKFYSSITLFTYKNVSYSSASQYFVEFIFCLLLFSSLMVLLPIHMYDGVFWITIIIRLLFMKICYLVQWKQIHSRKLFIM